MSFREKSVLVTISALVIVSVLYSAAVMRLAENHVVDEIPYRPLLLIAAIVLVIVTITGQVLAAATSARGNAQRADEGERVIGWRGQAARGSVLAVGAIVVLGLAVAEVPWFWIANALAAALVLAEVVAGALTLVLLRHSERGSELVPD